MSGSCVSGRWSHSDGRYCPGHLFWCRAMLGQVSTALPRRQLLKTQLTPASLPDPLEPLAELLRDLRSASAGLSKALINCIIRELWRWAE
jgi:hypothetical protein